MVSGRQRSAETLYPYSKGHASRFEEPCAPVGNHTGMGNNHKQVRVRLRSSVLLGWKE